MDFESLTLDAVQQQCAANFKNGSAYAQKDAVANPWRGATALHAEVSGSGTKPYIITIGQKAGGGLAPKCTCPAYRCDPFCKHVAAVLIAWVQSPAKFVVVQEPEPVAAVAEKKPVKKAAKPAEAAPRRSTPTSAADAEEAARLAQLTAGLDTAQGLMTELGTFGLLALTPEKVAAISTLAQVVGGYKLRRLARLVQSLHLTVERGLTQPDDFDDRAYAGLLTNLWYTIVATRRALADSSSDADLTEELIGKSWLDKDLPHTSGHTLIEVGYTRNESETEFVIESSYLCDITTGELFCERQISPTMIYKTPKPSYIHALVNCTLAHYPGASPQRVKLSIGSHRRITPDKAEALAAHAFHDFRAARATLNALHTSPLVPPILHCLLAPAALALEANTLYLVDAAHNALPVADAAIASLLFELASQSPLLALFGTLTPAADSLSFKPLSVIQHAGPILL